MIVSIANPKKFKPVFIQNLRQLMAFLVSLILALFLKIKATT
jgi:hypothetical protein